MKNNVEDEIINDVSEEEKSETLMHINEPILSPTLHESLVNNNKAKVNEIIEENSPIVIAESLNYLSDNEAILFFSMTNDFVSLGEIFSYLLIEHRNSISLTLDKKRFTQVLQYVKNDDLADYVEDIPKNIRNQILLLLPQKRKKEIENLASYSDDTVGSIMTTEFLTILSGSKVKDVLKKIKDVGEKLETVRTLYVVDSTNKLIGIKKLEELIFYENDETVNDIMDIDFAYISPIADKEEAIPICKQYDLATLPVLSKNGEILGIITFDDVLDVIEEANTEDILKRAGVAPTDESYLQTRPFKMALSYVLWLIIIAIINTFSSIIISKSESLLETFALLVVFFPVLNDTGGNSGNQTTSTITRALATNEITLKDFFKVTGKELVVGFLTALLVGTFNFAWVQFEFHTRLIDSDRDSLISIFGSLNTAYLIIGLIVSLSLVFSITLSKTLGSSLPILAKIFKIDPAVISGPLIACLMDILTLLIYFAIAKGVLNMYSPNILGGIL